MKGIDICKQFYIEYGAKMLHENFPDYEGVIAVAVTGSGSECYGFDDEISHDHDFEAGFTLFLPDESIVDSKTEFQLSRAYAKLPKSYMGLTQNPLQPVGGSRHGVKRMAEFFTEKIGSADGKLTTEMWMNTPDYYFAEATNGIILRDDIGLFTSIRNGLVMPQDVMKKKLASCLINMAQAGQYNYMRCISHGENASAQIALDIFAQNAMHAIFLLNNKFMPYYKWMFKSARTLNLLNKTASKVETLLTTTCEPTDKQMLIEEIASEIINELMNQQLTKATCGDLEKHAYSVNDMVADNNLRNAPIFSN